MIDQKSAREAGRATMAGHFKIVDEAIEAVKALSGAQAQAVLRAIAYDFPLEVITVIVEEVAK